MLYSSYMASYFNNNNNKMCLSEYFFFFFYIQLCINVETIVFFFHTVLFKIYQNSYIKINSPILNLKKRTFKYSNNNIITLKMVTQHQRINLFFSEKKSCYVKYFIIYLDLNYLCVC